MINPIRLPRRIPARHPYSLAPQPGSRLLRGEGTLATSTLAIR
jgi:hypothetical protein